MILKFNLLPKEKLETLEAESRKKYQFLKLAGILIFLTIFSITSTTFYFFYKIHSLNSAKKELLQKINKYKKIAKKVKTMEKENREIRQRIITILKLKSQQAILLKRLDYLLQAIDDNKVFFSDLKISEDRAQIKGISMDLEYIANYLKNLEKNKKIVKDVILKNTIKKGTEEVPYIEFNTEVKF